MRTNFNHMLQVEAEIIDEVTAGRVTEEHVQSALLVEISKALYIIADTLENIERRLDSDPDNTLH